MNAPIKAAVKNILPWLALSFAMAITAWIYWPGIDGPALLDDRSSISNLDRISDQPELASDYLFGDSSGLLGRTVSMGSFVLERLYLGPGVATSKRVNILLHLFNGALVIWLFMLLLRYAEFSAYRWVSILAGLAWLLSPLYVSTVLYVVQRMAMLATLFSLAALISYIYARLLVLRGKSGWYGFIPMLVFAILALLAKENAIVLVPLVLLMEALWFEFRGADGSPIIGLRRWVLGAMLAGAVSVPVLFFFSYDYIQLSYKHRHFSPSERMLTESRILWDYVGQLYWPQVSRMGLYHDDVIVSRSLWQPVTTLLAVLAWLAVLAACVALLFYRHGRYFVFALSVFIIGHSVESTILSLELYFEHRNYLPGIGLILAIAVVFGALVDKWPELQRSLLAWLGIYVLVLSTQTSSQVQIWSSIPLLRMHQHNSHPESFRANLDMANQLASVGALEAALEYSSKAHEVSVSERIGDRDLRDVALSCNANRALPAQRIAQLGTTDPERPLGSVLTFHVIVQMAQENACPNMDWIAFADRMQEIFLVEGYPSRASGNMYSQLAALENALLRYDNAYAYTERFLILSPANTRGMLMKLHFATALGKTAVATQLIESLQQLDEDGKLTVSNQQNLSLYLEN